MEPTTPNVKKIVVERDDFMSETVVLNLERNDNETIQNFCVTRKKLQHSYFGTGYEWNNLRNLLTSKYRAGTVVAV